MTHPESDIALVAGNLELRVRPESGGRISGLRYGDDSLLVGPEVNPNNWGTTYWTSPQASWGWPPVSSIDSDPFLVTSHAPLELVGPRGRVGDAELQLTKRFRALRGISGFELSYDLQNVGTRSARVAGWQISRVFPGGLTFFPTGANELTPIEPHGSLRLEKRSLLSVYDHRHFQPGRSLKVHADGMGGLLAHVARPVGRTPLLFLKAFLDSRPEEQAPGEGEVEIFANEDGAYVEVEVQGKLEVIEPGATSRFAVRWIVCPLPPGVRDEAFDPSLTEFAAELRSVAMLAPFAPE